MPGCAAQLLQQLVGANDDGISGSLTIKVSKGFAGCVRDAAGMEDVHPHDLKRTFGSWLVQPSIGIERVSALLRHGDVAITSRVYAHLRPGDLADSEAILDRQTRTPTGNHFHADFHATQEGGAADTKKPL